MKDKNKKTTNPIVYKIGSIMFFISAILNLFSDENSMIYLGISLILLGIYKILLKEK